VPLLIRKSRALAEIASLAARHAIVLGVASAVVFAVHAVSASSSVVASPPKGDAAVMAASGIDQPNKRFVRKRELADLSILSRYDSRSNSVENRFVGTASPFDPSAGAATVQTIKLIYRKLPFDPAFGASGDPALIPVGKRPCVPRRAVYYNPLPNCPSRQIDIHLTGLADLIGARPALSATAIAKAGSYDAPLVSTIATAGPSVNAVRLRGNGLTDNGPAPEPRAYRDRLLNAFLGHSSPRTDGRVLLRAPQSYLHKGIYHSNAVVRRNLDDPLGLRVVS
jgi:hypothetical protein